MTRRVTALVLLSLAALLLHGRFVVPYVMEWEAQEAERRRLQAERDGESISAEDRAALVEQVRDIEKQWRAETPRVQIADGLPGRRVPPLGKVEAYRQWQLPTIAVQGKLLTADDDHITFALGAGSGLARNDILLVYRLWPSARVVGIARVIEIHGNHSMACIIYLLTTLGVGDQVCSEAFLKR